MTEPVEVMGEFDLADTRLGVVRGISYGLFGPAERFVEPVRDLGTRLVRAYVYWGQVEPRPGEYRWDVVDSLLGQFDGDEELWITVCSSSQWATRQPTDFLPPSPALDLETYGRFVGELVRHCAGRVRYWQCDNEPSNTALLWAGSATEYVSQLRVMFEAVKDADPGAAVVLGGCGYDVLSSEPGSESRQFFDDLVGTGRDAFDLFDVHLYGRLSQVPDYIDQVRTMMRAHGYLKPVVVGEYNGPSVFEFPEAEAVLYQAMEQAFSQPTAPQSTAELAAPAAQDTPERRAVRSLYDRMNELPPQLQMFMAGCPAELDAKRYRMSCRGLVVRNVLALAAGIRRTACWNLGPEVPEYHDPLQIMDLMFRTYALMDYENGRLTKRHPTADAFAHLVRQLGQVERVQRLELGDLPAVQAFEVQRVGQRPLLVLWEQRDDFTGEDLPPIAVSLPWTPARAQATDAFGKPHRVDVAEGALWLDLSLTPVFVSVPE